MTSYPEHKLAAPWLELRKYRAALAAALGLDYGDGEALGWDKVLELVCASRAELVMLRKNIEDMCSFVADLADSHEVDT